MYIWKESPLQLQKTIYGKQMKVVQSATGILREWEQGKKYGWGHRYWREPIPPSVLRSSSFLPDGSSRAATTEIKEPLISLKPKHLIWPLTIALNGPC